MKKQSVSATTILEPYGLVRISGEVERNPFYTFEERQFEPPFYVRDLKVIAPDGKVLQGLEEKAVSRWTGLPAHCRICGLDQIEVEKCEEVLIEKFLENEGFEQDRLIDEMIERGRSLARYAYA